jgi:hypothetical protein
MKATKLASFVGNRSQRSTRHTSLANDNAPQAQPTQPKGQPQSFWLPDQHRPAFQGSHDRDESNLRGRPSTHKGDDRVGLCGRVPPLRSAEIPGPRWPATTAADCMAASDARARARAQRTRIARFCAAHFRGSSKLARFRSRIGWIPARHRASSSAAAKPN